jgi:hypothetical protein
MMIQRSGQVMPIVGETHHAVELSLGVVDTLFIYYFALTGVLMD